MSLKVSFNYPVTGVVGEFNGLVGRRTSKGDIVYYALPKRNLEQHPVTEKEFCNRETFKRRAALVTKMMHDPEELQKHQLGYEVFCTVKQVTMRNYLMKVVAVLEKHEAEQ